MRLRRQTSSGLYIPEIDGLRFIAITSVIFFHTITSLRHTEGEGALSRFVVGLGLHGVRGVSLFFTISGFILGMPFARHLLCGSPPVRLRDYFLRRLTRLEPPYFIVMLALFLITTFAYHPAVSQMPHFLAGVFYLHSLLYGKMNPLYSPAWSLEVEIQFYCLAPLLAILLLSMRPAWLRRALICLLMLLSGLVQVRFFHSLFFTLSILNYAQYFVAGFLLCDLFLTDWDAIPEHWVWDVASIPLWLVIFASEYPYFHAVMPFLTVIVYVGAFKGPLMRWFFRKPFVATVGGMCYSIYLTHGVVLTYANELLLKVTKTGPWPLWILAPIGLVETILCGGIYYVLIEHPCMDKEWPSKLWRLFSGVQKPQ